MSMVKTIKKFWYKIESKFDTLKTILTAESFILTTVKLNKKEHREVDLNSIVVLSYGNIEEKLVILHTLKFTVNQDLENRIRAALEQKQKDTISSMEDVMNVVKNTLNNKN